MPECRHTFCETCPRVIHCLHYLVVVCCHNTHSVFPARQTSLWWATQIKLSMVGEAQMWSTCQSLLVLITQVWLSNLLIVPWPDVLGWFDGHDVGTTWDIVPPSLSDHTFQRDHMPNLGISSDMTDCICNEIWQLDAGATTLHLKDNYRSTPQVLRGAEGVLNNILSTGVTPERVVLNPLQNEGPQIQVHRSKCCTEACSAVLSLS